MAKWTTTNEDISTKLEEFGLPVAYGALDNETLETYNFFFYREEELVPVGSRLTQILNIAYVSYNQEDLMEAEIIQALSEIRLKFGRATYDRLQIEGTNNFIDVVTFICARNLKMDCNG